jgi:hypothetical protein
VDSWEVFQRNLPPPALQMTVKVKNKVARELWQKIRKFLGGCEHFWRPAVLSVAHKPYVPIKICDDCGKIVVLQVSDFYAHFFSLPAPYSSSALCVAR